MAVNRRYLSGVVTLRLDESRCNGCGMCMTVCPQRVFATANGKAQVVDRDACMECGACQNNCPEGAIEVQSGVGCVTAIFKGALNGTEPDCDCSGKPSCC
jgi:NAD-dependent dihydropyrimidine dehydrogenase PreA subunit